MLLYTADLWRANIERFSEIDSRFGDGDHGVTIGKIANCLTAAAESREEKSLKNCLSDLGGAIMAVGGGSAGPLYGTLIGSLAEPLGDETSLDGPLLKRMLHESREAMFAITKARVGDKTMMDSFIPAVDAALASEDDAAAILAAAARAAAEGATATKGVASRFGRARSYGEQTLGTPDAGACSTAILFQGLAEGFTK